MISELAVDTVVDRLAGSVRDAASPTGGWGYYPGKRARIEPTCWALMALQGGAEDPTRWADVAAPHLRMLAQCQTAAGTLSDTGGATTNLAFDGLAAATLPHVAGPAGAALTLPLLRAIIAAKGIKADQADARQDNSLQAWPWYPDTFSWVEPTAWCLLALKKFDGSRSPDARARIDEAERMLENRCCDGGGWNYGNASVIGQDLRPHVPPTALALIALQDRADRPFVQRSLARLEELRLTEDSSLALGLTVLALHLQGRPTADVRSRLAAIAGDAVDRGDVHAIAVALLALTVDRHDGRALRVA
jgi:hypothetical protein